MLLCSISSAHNRIKLSSHHTERTMDDISVRLKELYETGCIQFSLCGSKHCIFKTYARQTQRNQLHETVFDRFQPNYVLLLNTEKKFEVLAVVKMACSSGLRHNVDLKADANISGKILYPSSGLKNTVFLKILYLLETLRLSFVLHQIRNDCFM